MSATSTRKVLRAVAAATIGAVMSWTLLVAAAVPAGADKSAGKPATQPAGRAPTTMPAASPASKPATAPSTAPAEPCLTPTTAPTTKPAGGEIERFAAGSPFGPEYKPPKEIGGKRIWAYSCLWAKAPKLEVEKWLTPEPKTDGKFVLIEFWATWCPPCRKSITLLNDLHKKFGKDLVVIGISHESEADVRALKAPKIEYLSAIDTKARTKKELGVFGIPHVILIEPGGGVVWEGFPLLKGHELTDKTVAKMIEIGRKSGSLK